MTLYSLPLFLSPLESVLKSEEHLNKTCTHCALSHYTDPAEQTGSVGSIGNDSDFIIVERRLVQISSGTPIILLRIFVVFLSYSKQGLGQRFKLGDGGFFLHFFFFNFLRIMNDHLPQFLSQLQIMSLNKR